jgi:hypothetical protein
MGVRRMYGVQIGALVAVRRGGVYLRHVPCRKAEAFMTHYG